MEFLIGIASAIVGEITKYTIAPVGRQLGYLFHYQNNRDKLSDKIEKLEGERESINHQIEEGRKKGEKTHEKVDNWLNKEETSSKEAEDLLNDKGHPKAECSCSGSFPNLVLRHQLSRKLKKMADTIEAIIAEVDLFQNNITFRPALIESSFENKDFEVFATRTPCLMAIMEALKDPNCSKIGVCGIGGVGKTTLVQEVARQAQEEKIFSMVVMVTVSQTFDPRKIQKEIAEKLGLPLDEKSMSTRANRLQDRLNQLKREENILMIFDDIWEKLELKDIGIEFKEDNQKDCKILLVSRGQHLLLNEMRVEKHFEVGVLSREESMKLFKKFVGQERCFEDLATDIVGQCGGLPIAIVPIAITLRNRERFVWDDVLNKLKECSKEGYEEGAYPSIKTSYEFFKGKQGKQILLLCSLHKEDTNINVENLMSIYGAYSDMFLDKGTLEEARSSVLTSVDELKRCYLLLSGDEDGTIKLHDVIRKIMVSIALEEVGMRCFESFEKLEKDSNRGKLNDSTAILLIDHDIKRLPENLACPRLKLLLVHEESYRSLYSPAVLFSKQFFEAAEELRALCLRSLAVKPLPLLSSSLRKLQTLSLQNCVIEEIGFIGELDSLLVLDLSNSEFKELPEQIGKLTCLRQLNLNNCVHLKVIRPKVISRLSNLEELYMDHVHIEWRKEAVGGESMNASLDELNMSQLRALHLCIKDANVLPKGMFVDAKLNRFNIRVECKKHHSHATSSKLLQLWLNEQSQLHEYGFQMLMKDCEVLCLGILPGVNNIICQLDADGFPRLKKLYIHENDEVQHIVESTGEIQPSSAFQNLETLELHSVQNIEKICCGSFRLKPFGQLRRITVSKCNKLKNVLPYFVDIRLEEIVVKGSMVKEIIYLNGEDHATNCDKIEFPHLRSVTLESLPKLIHFFSSEIETTYGCTSSADTLGNPFFNAKVAFPSLQILELFDINFSNLWPNQLPTTSTLQSLTTLKVTQCHKLKYVFPFAIVGGLRQLEQLKVIDCSAMEEIITGVEEEGMSSKKILFPKLKYLNLENLESLRSFCDGDCNVELESLLILTIENCALLKTFTSKTRVDQEIGQPLINEKVVFKSLQELSVVNCKSLLCLCDLATFESLQQLRKLEVRGCELMEEVLVVTKEAGDQDRNMKKISFPKLIGVDLHSLPKVKRFCQADYTIVFPSLLELEIFDCPELKTFIAKSTTSATIIEKDVEEREVAEEVLFSRKVVFKTLQKLRIQKCNSLLSLWELAKSENIQHLTRLYIYECELLEAILVVAKEAGDQEIKIKKISFPKLHTLLLCDLPKLKSFCQGDCTIEFLNDLQLEIQNCTVLRTFIANSTCSTSTIEKVVKEREMNEEVLFNGKVMFKCLDWLAIERCDSLLSLWDLATFENLQRLGILRIESCELMEVVLVVRKKAGDQERKMKKISFPKLFRLVLRDLPKLKSFCQGDCTIELSSELSSSSVYSLLDVEIDHCPELRTFIAKSTRSTSNNEKVEEERQMADEILFNGKVAFSNLRELDVSHCENLKYLLSFAIAGKLVQLRKLEVTDCSMMEEIVVEDGEEEEEVLSSRKILFPELSTLKLKNLQSFKAFCAGGYDIGSNRLITEIDHPLRDISNSNFRGRFKSFRRFKDSD